MMTSFISDQVMMTSFISDQVMMTTVISVSDILIRLSCRSAMHYFIQIS